jgi:hypothetical protein
MVKGVAAQRQPEPNMGRRLFNGVPRYAALLWSAGVTENFWFEYDTAPGWYCPLGDGSSLTPAGIAWNTTYKWLVGATPVNSPFCSAFATLWTCPLTDANGKPKELVWDSQFGPGGTTEPSNCTTASNPLICGDTPYSVPSEYGHDWVDTEGTVHPFRPTVTVCDGGSGANSLGMNSPTTVVSWKEALRHRLHLGKDLDAQPLRGTQS